MTEYKQGQQIWRAVLDTPSFKSGAELQAFWPTARESAALMVRRLAPELESLSEIVIGGVMTTVDVLVDRANTPVAWLGGTLVNSTTECCSYTFYESEPIPPWERALTFYLYKKLLPERFNNRPMDRP